MKQKCSRLLVRTVLQTASSSVWKPRNQYFVIIPPVSWESCLGEKSLGLSQEESSVKLLSLFCERKEYSFPMKDTASLPAPTPWSPNTSYIFYLLERARIIEYLKYLKKGPIRIIKFNSLLLTGLPSIKLYGEECHPCAPQTLTGLVPWPLPWVTAPVTDHSLKE